MLKLLFTSCSLLLSLCCIAQQRTTFISQTTSGGDEDRFTYTISATGDSLTIGNAAFYRISATPKETFFIADADTIRLNFKDTGQQVWINNDCYHLYPAYYAQFKQAVLTRHSVMAILDFLDDAIGDYPIAAALPLLLFTPQTTKRIQIARTITHRSQADISDTWDCVYRYNKNGSLDSMSATSGQEVRFSKKVRYARGKVLNIKTFKNLEDRQITDRIISYPSESIVKLHDSVLETGKNRQTELKITLKKSAK